MAGECEAPAEPESLRLIALGGSLALPRLDRKSGRRGVGLRHDRLHGEPGSLEDRARPNRNAVPTRSARMVLSRKGRAAT